MANSLMGANCEGIYKLDSTVRTDSLIRPNVRAGSLIRTNSEDKLLH